MPTENKTPDKPNELAERESKPAKSEYGKAKTASVIFNVFLRLWYSNFFSRLSTLIKKSHKWRVTEKTLPYSFSF